MHLEKILTDTPQGLDEASEKRLRKYRHRNKWIKQQLKEAARKGLKEYLITDSDLKKEKHEGFDKSIRGLF